MMQYLDDAYLVLDIKDSVGVDPERGKQPMVKQNKRTGTLLYNGELPILKIFERVATKRIFFNGHSDTEVLLTAILNGKKNVDHLNGILLCCLGPGERCYILAK
jgi:asparagine synthetase B (glutamine-hydrolysing)